MKRITTATVFLSALFLSQSAQANNDSSFPSNIPELTQVENFDNVRSLTQKETFDIYAGQTIDYPEAVLYFKPNGGVVGYSKDGRGYTFGTWKVVNYKFCMKNVWHYSGKPTPEIHWTCNEWYSDGSAYWTKVTKSTLDGYLGQVIRGDIRLVNPGDHASLIVSKMEGKKYRDVR